jgi:putative ABC transport system permease protein
MKLPAFKSQFPLRKLSIPKIPQLKFVSHISDKFQIERPLALAQLVHQKPRLFIAMGGIAFANVLIFMQLGFRSVFTDGAKLLPTSLQGDLFVINQSAQYIGANEIQRTRLYQAGGIQGVATVTPLYIQTTTWSYSKDFTSFGARVLAFNPNKTIFNLPEINQQLEKLKLPNSVLLDRRARQSFGPIPKLFADKGEVHAVVNNYRISVNGFFHLGNSFFQGEGNVAINESNYAKIFGQNALEKVSLGIVKLDESANIASVKAGIENSIPGVKVLTQEELIAQEIAYQEKSPAGAIFSFGAIMGFIVGVVIVYQVLYADVTDHLAEYATLKAIGYPNSSLLAVIFQEALILSVVGFMPGFVISYTMYGLLSMITGLELAMQLNVASTVFILTVIMCVASAVITSGKLRSADPADVF